MLYVTINILNFHGRINYKLGDGRLGQLVFCFSTKRFLPFSLKYCLALQLLCVNFLNKEVFTFVFISQRLDSIFPRICNCDVDKLPRVFFTDVIQTQFNISKFSSQLLYTNYFSWKDRKEGFEMNLVSYLSSVRAWQNLLKTEKMKIERNLKYFG